MNELKIRTSESQTSIVPAMLAFRKECPPLQKTKEGQAGNRKFKYAPLDAILPIITPLLSAQGLLLTHIPNGNSITVRVDHVSGEWREGDMPMEEQFSSDQAYGISLTYRRRYSAQMILGIVTEDDVDGNPKSFRSSPTMGVFNTLSPSRKAVISDVADFINEHIAADDVCGAYEEAENITDSEEKTALWGLLDSKVRSAIKKYGQSLKETA
jgi:hypothetical protein